MRRACARARSSPSLAAALVGGAARARRSARLGWATTTRRCVVVAVLTTEASRPDRRVGQARCRQRLRPGRDLRRRSQGVVTIYAFFGDHPAQDATMRRRAPASSSRRRAHPHERARDHDRRRDRADASRPRQVFVEFARRRPRRRRDRRLGPLRRRRRAAGRSAGPSRSQPLPLGDSERVVVGEPVAAIGSPFGNDDSLAVGVVVGDAPLDRRRSPRATTSSTRSRPTRRSTTATPAARCSTRAAA